ncbi:MAG: YafY family transcriptional regulator [Oscillospiraceae bacterium]|nr:YafY family transcriptional regulator [Oscillospiraceae bacterium]
MKIDRLIGILSILLQRDRVTAPYLAERFEVSRHTILRDIEALCKAGIPIATTQGAGGGISIMEGYRIDRTLLTSSDMQAILAGLRSLDSVSGTRRYAQLMEKMQAGTSAVLTGDNHILIDLASWYKASLSEKIELIHSAIEQGRTIRFHYYAPTGESDRTVEPYYLVFQWSSWYVWGWCRGKEDFRLFKLNRMTDLTVGDGFEKRAAAYPDLRSERVFPANYQVKAMISGQYKWRLVEEYGAGCYEEQPDGSCLFSCGFTDRDQILTWILSFQGEAELLEPVELREELGKIGAALREKYRGT